MGNFYPPWWSETVTIYNRYEDEQTHLISWYSHVVSGCFWKYVGEKISIGETIMETNNTICRIPENADYKPRYEWNELPNDEMSNYFTLGKDDIIVLGEVSDIIDEYTKGSRSTDLIAKYKKLQGCMTIEQYADNTGTGRGQKHYYVRGI